MSTLFDQIKRGDSTLPPRTLIAGPEGIGKTTFGVKAPPPLLAITAEEGLTGFDYIQRFTPQNFFVLLELVDALIKDDQGFKALLFDTADWLERLIYESICKRDNVANIEAYGYGKGYPIAELELVNLLKKLDDLRMKRKMWIVITSHVQIKGFSDPAGETYDRYEMKGHKRMTGILREWPDACLFATNEVFKVKANKAKGERNDKTIGGERVMHTTWSPAWDAKNRLGLPETLPLDWDAYVAAIEANSPAALSAQARALYATAKIPDAQKPAWERAVKALETIPTERIRAAIENLSKLQ